MNDIERHNKDVERLIAAQALYKAAAEIVDTKNPDSLRGQIDEYYRRAYANTGGKTYDMHFDGEKVGTYSLRFSKGTEQETRSEFVIKDFEALASWYDGLDDATLRMFAAYHLKTLAEWAYETNGELPSGCAVENVIIPATDPQLTGGTLRIDHHKVLNRINALIGADVVGLLEGGEDGA